MATPRGGSGLHRCFVSEQPNGSSWEIRIPRDSSVAVLFEKELSLISALPHKHIIAVLDAGRVKAIPFYAVKDGISLLDHVHRNTILRPEAVIRLLQDLATALALCHDRNVLLGSFSPLGVRWLPEGPVLDSFAWPAARLVFPDPEGLAIGNPTFFSPEFCRGDAVDGRSDLYGLGAIAYLCLAGEPAHDATSTVDILQKKTLAAPSLLKVAPRVPTELATLIQSMLAPEPSERPQSAQEVLERLSLLTPSV